MIAEEPLLGETDRARKRIYLYDGIEFVLQLNVLPDWGPSGRWVLLTDIETLNQFTVTLAQQGRCAIRRGFLGPSFSLSIPEPASRLSGVRQAINHACFHLLRLRLQRNGTQESTPASTCDEDCDFYAGDFRDDGYQDGYMLDSSSSWGPVPLPERAYFQRMVDECLNEAKSEFRSRRMLAASTNAWGSIANCIRAISSENGWPANSRPQVLNNAVQMLSAGRVDKRGIARLSEIADLYRVSPDEELEPEPVRKAIADAKELVKRLRRRSQKLNN